MDLLPTPADLMPLLRRLGIQLPAGTVCVSAFGDSPELSQELLALIREGRKRGGASLVWSHEADAEPIPAAGEIEIVVDHMNAPAFITRVVKIEVLPFSEVGADFAAREGEGDGSLEHWRREHWQCFSRECARIGRQPSQDMPVVCTSFEVLHVVPLSSPCPD